MLGYMAVARLNVALESIRGKIGDLVFRHFPDKIVINRAYDYSKRQRSARQKASSARFCKARLYADAKVRDPQQKAMIMRRAKRLHLTPRGYFFKEYCRMHPWRRKRKR